MTLVSRLGVRLTWVIDTCSFEVGGREERVELCMN